MEGQLTPLTNVGVGDMVFARFTEDRELVRSRRLCTILTKSLPKSQPDLSSTYPSPHSTHPRQQARPAVPAMDRMLKYSSSGRTFVE